MKRDMCLTGVLLAVAMLPHAVPPSGTAAGATPLRSGTTTPAPVWHIAGQGRGRPLVDRGRVYFLSNRHEVLAVDPPSGTVRWRNRTGEPGDATMGTSLVATGSV